MYISGTLKKKFLKGFLGHSNKLYQIKFANILYTVFKLEIETKWNIF